MIELREPVDERNQVDVGERILLAHQPGTVAKGSLHPFHDESRRILAGVDIVLAKPAVRGLRPALSPLLEGNARDRLAQLGRRQFVGVHLEGRPDARHHAGKTLVARELRPHPHAGPAERRCRPQRRIGKFVINIFVDQHRFDDRHAVVHECRNHATGIERDIFRSVLLERAQVEVMAAVGEPFFAQAKARLARAGGVAAVIKLEHARYS